VATKAKEEANPFAEAEAWGTNAGQYLPEGAFVCLMDEVEDVTAGTGNPQIKIHYVEEQTGREHTGFTSYHETFLGKVVELYDSSGLARPGPGEFDPADHCRINKEKVAQLRGKKVGVVLRKEDSGKKDGKQYVRLQGHVPPSKVPNAPVNQNTQSGSTGVQVADDDDIPF
jgi:hypothetical protein